MRTRSRIMVMMYRVIDGAWKCQCHTSPACDVIGLIECIPSKPMKSEESEKALWGAEDKTSRRDKTIFLSIPAMLWKWSRTAFYAMNSSQNRMSSSSERRYYLPETPDAGWNLGR